MLAGTVWCSSWPVFVLDVMSPGLQPRQPSPTSWSRERPSVSSVSRRRWSVSWELAAAATASLASRPAGRRSRCLAVAADGWWSLGRTTVTATFRVRPALFSFKRVWLWRYTLAAVTSLFLPYLWSLHCNVMLWVHKILSLRDVLCN